MSACGRPKVNCWGCDELINNPNFMEEAIERYAAEVIDDEEWI